MTRIAREGDTSDHGLGGITDPAIEPTVTVNGKPIAVNRGGGTGGNTDALFDPDNHPEGDTIPGPVEGSDTVFAGGAGVHRLGDARGCGAITVTASSDVHAN